MSAWEVLPSRLAAFVAALLAWTVAIMVAERDAARVRAGPVEHLADALISSAPSYDDAVVLAARLPPRSAPVLERRFPAQAVSAGVARVWLSDLFDILRADGVLRCAVATETLGVAQLVEHGKIVWFELPLPRTGC